MFGIKMHLLFSMRKYPLFAYFVCGKFKY